MTEEQQKMVDFLKEKYFQDGSKMFKIMMVLDILFGVAGLFLCPYYIMTYKLFWATIWGIQPVISSVSLYVNRKKYGLVKPETKKSEA